MQSVSPSLTLESLSKKKQVKVATTFPLIRLIDV